MQWCAPFRGSWLGLCSGKKLKGDLMQPHADNIYIVQVDQHSPADIAGMKAGDRVMWINGTTTTARLVPHVVSKITGAYGNFNIMLDHFSRMSQLLCHPDTRRMMCSTSCPCSSDADRCLQSSTR